MEDKDVNELAKVIADSEKWLEDARKSFRDLKPHVSPKTKVADIRQHLKTFESLSSPIINKKKPTVEPPKDVEMPEVTDDKNKDNGGKPTESTEKMDVE